MMSQVSIPDPSVQVIARAADVITSRSRTRRASRERQADEILRAVGALADSAVMAMHRFDLATSTGLGAFAAPLVRLWTARRIPHLAETVTAAKTRLDLLNADPEIAGRADDLLEAVIAFVDAAVTQRASQTTDLRPLREHVGNCRRTLLAAASRNPTGRRGWKQRLSRRWRACA